ncbi:polyhydroxyalkanoate depolymerase [Alteraurantiacibacter buctensis]|uniref:Polyhydroxyalkanoate depolymerase n=1 Tax=Alteraurantiacibacter buctensis TaxID=1503981 RepID=A0A844YS09_9SPHN|nr:polyhydroxyalkanoate depolymerase [Alteraurantiacibacter buctensis]MXO70349.1 polyhydroxyalkanoate depolymerase [Alteraurantiacibacter buctensis]
MLYSAYEMHRSFMNAASNWAAVGAQILSNPALPIGYFGMGPAMASALKVFAHIYEERGKPEFGIAEVKVDGKSWPVTESVVLEKPFGSLRHFKRKGLPKDAPKLLLVAPMSGHYATLLRGTVERLVQNQEVWITDWADAKLVPLSAGTFDLDDYIDYLIEYLHFIGEGTHVLAVCQPSVPAFAATAVMAADKDPFRPATLTMMGGPVDTRASPTSVNDVAMQRPLSWFRNNVIATVPLTYAGAGRKVYPGFLQLAGFISMNIDSHMQSHYQMFQHLTVGDHESAEATRRFYDEYLSVCDMTAEFYLQTIEHVFQQHSLPRGLFVHRGKAIDPGAIRDTALLAIEGERDDISGLGQTKAALDLAADLPEAKKQYFMAPEVGHYGIFNGSRWRENIAPVVEDWLRANAR